jgi:hypothetical protein
VTYDVVTSARSAQFQVYNFGITESQITRLPLIQGVTQTDCSSLTLTTSYGRVLNYKITDYGPHSLHIERDLTQDQNEPIKAIAEAQKFEPEIKSLKVTVESAHTIFFQIAAKTLFAHCGAERLKEYSKDFRLHLRDPATSFSDTEKVNSYYLQQIKQLIPTSVEGASELSPLADQVSVSEILNLQNLLRSKEISSSCASSI